MKRLFALSAAICIIAAGCKQNPSSPPPSTNPAVAHAVYILNEGNFGHGNATLTLYDESAGAAYTDIFSTANSGEHLGDAGQDIKVAGGKIYVTLSGSKGIVELRESDHAVLRRADTSRVATPYDMLVDPVDNKLFVGDLYANTVVALSLDSLKYERTIAVGTNPQGMALARGKVYVCNSGFGGDSTVTVFSATTGQVSTTLRVGIEPIGAALSPAGEVVICCAGVDTATPGRLMAFDPAADTLTRSIGFPGSLEGGVAIDDLDYAYVIGSAPDSYAGAPGPVHKVNLANNHVQLNLITASTYYAIAFNPNTGELVLTDVLDYAGKGKVTIAGTDGTVKKTFTAGIIPGAIAFSW